MEPRHITLLRAARDLIAKQKNSHFVLDLTAETVFYDDTDCDGSCLLDDINAFLDEYEPRYSGPVSVPPQWIHVSTNAPNELPNSLTCSYCGYTIPGTHESEPGECPQCHKTMRRWNNDRKP